MRHTYGKPLPYAAVCWFRLLTGRVWWSPDGRRHALDWDGLDLARGHSCDRSLTGPEFDAVVELIRDYGLVCRMLTGDYSYRFCVGVYDHPPQPHAPPVPVFAFSDAHLPSSNGKLSQNPDHAWKTLSKYFTHVDDNLDLLEIYGLPPPSARELYEW